MTPHTRPFRLSVSIVGTIIVAFLVTALPTHAQTVEWVRQFGTFRTDVELAVAKGPGAVYVAGNTTGIFPGESSAALTGSDAFVSRYDELGNAVWTRQFGSTTGTADSATGVITDQTGIYVVGWTQGALPGQTSAGSTDAFICKHDAGGNLLWTRQFGTTAVDEVLGVATDGTGVYVVGRTLGNIGPGAPASASEDAFIRRYDTNGGEGWARQFGTGESEQAYSVATDTSGIYVAGNTTGALAASAAGNDGFLRKYDAEGRVFWTRQFGTSSTDHVFAAAAAGALGVYVAGDTAAALPGQTKAGGLYDAFLMRLDVSGTQQWVRQFGTNSDDVVYGLAVTAGAVAVVGKADDTMPRSRIRDLH